MSAAAALPRGPFARGTPVLRTARQHATGSAAAFRTATGAIRRAAGAADRIAAGIRASATSVRRLAAPAAGTAGAVTRVGGPGAGAGVRGTGTGAARARTAAARLGSGVGGLLALFAPLIDVGGLLSGLLGPFGTALTVGSVAMTGINTAMRANPVGFLIGILVPVAAYLVELAVNSRTGQRIIAQVMSQALAGFRSVLAFLGPVLRALGSTVAASAGGWRTVITGVLRGIGAAVGGLTRIRSTVSAAGDALRGITARVWTGLRDAVRPVVRWITSSVPGFFSRVRTAVSGTLGAIGRFVESGLQIVLGVVKGPVNALIAFANWLIDGLNELSFSVLGKKFGVHFDKLPMLAEGGVVLPGAPDRAPRILPLSELDHRRVLAPAAPAPPARLAEFREEAGAGPRSTAEDLLFLATATATALPGS
ncbi:tape-measure protein [Streptomyces sp. LP05-1]|uniref:Tape-measure protein n=1 Tax=Streptomyces pyxinae TaxID=2970734 RepID=A0ABT2CJG7_9ACTN|nr:tape-measure protein [Streptomyces sp. LP05-1]MCS0637217.1 tape-measure protein [Streptomyces sp. LP05-1]